MNKIEKLTINNANTEVLFVEPKEDNPLNIYNKELPAEYKKANFLDMPEEWQLRKIAAYCDFMKETIPNSMHLITKANTMLACSLANIDFPAYQFETEFSPTHFAIEKHKVKINLNFCFNYLSDNSPTEIEIFESEEEATEQSEKISDIWHSPIGVIELAHNVFTIFPKLNEEKKIVLCSSLLIQIQNAIDINSVDTNFDCSGFTNDSLDSTSELAQKMAVATMSLSINIRSPQYSLKAKKLH